MKTLLIFLNIFFLFVLFYFLNKSYEPYKCETKLMTRTEKDSNYMLFNGNVSLFIESKHEGFYTINGKVQTRDNTYLLRRQVYFTFIPNEFNNIKTIKVNKTEVHSSDNTPEKIWRDNVFPGKPGNPFPIEIWRLKDNLVLLKFTDTGNFICPRIAW
ncbi:Uncharacterised protein [Serratia entomophila]|nr:Uncharacterised protein [Serratia entomophila]CAI1541166.1 Uncharacterised protein [Serratia entomophila]CAI1550111.1 Uncharacterised protein [Serratia entomophila]CAI1635040.1 Uncharacterised protein [Serratia entomophila]CAI1663159.1 Uncharacterised protein [Serratia entomophila]